MNYKLGLTFDDVLLEPQSSNVLPKDVDISSRITKNIKCPWTKLSKLFDFVR